MRLDIKPPIDGGGNGFIGDYQGIASNNDYDFPFWNATANLGENIQNYQEIFIARMPVPYYNLSASDSLVVPEVVSPSGILTYTITLENLGLDADPAVNLRDFIPISTSYLIELTRFSIWNGWVRCYDWCYHVDR